MSLMRFSSREHLVLFLQPHVGSNRCELYSLNDSASAA